jgi:hypothetical protein
MIALLTQLLTSFTATGIITLVVTHMHQDSLSIEWLLWFLHWLVAWPIAFSTVRWIAPVYQKFFMKALNENQSK